MTALMYFVASLKDETAKCYVQRHKNTYIICALCYHVFGVLCRLSRFYSQNCIN